MLSDVSFIKQSLATHLFFARIMKEHSFFLELGFTPKNSKYTQEADSFRLKFDELLSDVVALSNGNVNSDVLQSGEVITQFTIDAEMASTYYSGVKIQTSITRSEINLSSGDRTTNDTRLARNVHIINQNAIDLLNALIQFKTEILNNVLSCNMFTVNYPLLIDHILREAKFYLGTILRLQNKEEIDIQRLAYEQEYFWNTIMAEHSKFIRGLLDPTEEDLIETANNFGKTFDKLTSEAKYAIDKSLPISQVTEDSLQATQDIQEFKTAGTKGILDCKIKSIIIPLLGDHVLREANHYLRLLKIFDNI
jgi:hypothetical protein